MDLPGKHLPPLHSDLPGKPLPGKRQNDTHHQTEAYPAELIEHLTTSPSQGLPQGLPHPGGPCHRARRRLPHPGVPCHRARGRLPHPGVPCHRPPHPPESHATGLATGPNLPQVPPPARTPSTLPCSPSSCHRHLIGKVPWVPPYTHQPFLTLRLVQKRSDVTRHPKRLPVNH